MTHFLAIILPIYFCLLPTFVTVQAHIVAAPAMVGGNLGCLPNPGLVAGQKADAREQ